MPRGARLLLLAALSLALVVVWVHPGPRVLYGVDAGCYARVAGELASRPVGSWARPTLAGAPFYEHPPLALWAEALFLRLFGPAPESLITLARLYASMLVLLVLAIAWRTAGVAAGALAVVALPLLSGFSFEAQNPMLELPFAVALAVGLLGCVASDSRAATPLLAGGIAAAFLVKGPPALVLLVIASWAFWHGKRPQRVRLVVAVAAGLSCVAAVATILGREYVAGYLGGQVSASLLGERDTHAIHGALFYSGVLWKWYAAGLVCVPFSVYAYVRAAREGRTGITRLLELGWLTTGALVLGFSVVAKKNAWYIHPAMVGLALMMGATGAALMTDRWLDRVAKVGVGAMILYLGVAAVAPGLWHQGQRRAELEVIHTLAAPAFAPNERREIAHCGRTGDWKAMHLFALKWRAKLVPCQSPAPYVFDGKRLLQQSRH